MLKYNNYNFILDRSYLGEFIYSPLYRGYDADYVFDYEKELLPKIDNIVLIMLTDDIENCLKRDDGKSHSINKEMKEKEAERFNIAFDRSCIRHKKKINIKNKSIEQVQEEILTYIKGLF